jgi:hypothetical protein
MNTKSKTSRIAIAAALTGIALAATACGTETSADVDRASQKSVKTSSQTRLGSPDAIEGAARARAEHADALRWARGYTTDSQRARAERADALRWAHGHSLRD